MEYKFYDRLSSTFPSQVMVDVTQVCNLSCIHCPHPAYKVSEYYTAEKLEPYLIKKMAEEIKKESNGITKYVRFTSNGEPLLHKNIINFLADTKSISGTTVALTTNGTYLKTKNINKIIETGIDIIDISIDAFKDETYKMIRNGNLKITRENVLNLIKIINKNNSKLKVIVSYIEQPLNVKETNDFKNFWETNGASKVIVRTYHSCSGAKKELAEQFKKEQISIQRRPCLYPWERIVLNAHGFLSFCPQDWENGSLISDFRETTIKECWQGQFYQNLRNAHLKNSFKDFSFCGNCPDWIHTNWPDDGLSYANMVEDIQSAE